MPPAPAGAQTTRPRFPCATRASLDLLLHAEGHVPAAHFTVERAVGEHCPGLAVVLHEHLRPGDAVPVGADDVRGAGAEGHADEFGPDADHGVAGELDAD